MNCCNLRPFCLQDDGRMVVVFVVFVVFVVVCVVFV